MIFGSRIKQVREIRGLTQSKLAAGIGVKQPAIAQFENGSRQPAPETLQAIAFRTSFPAKFFEREPRTEFPLGTLLFRGKARMLEREKAEAHALASLLYEGTQDLAANINTLPLKLPVLTDQRPAEAAALTRSALGLAPGVPVRNLLHHLESAGVFVLALPQPLPNRDAFSAWTSADIPVLALSPEKPGCRQRYSAAHEVGHLVMHRQIRDNARELEREADDFASEFLMPKAAMLQELPRPITFVRLAQLKPRWGVSIAALVRRAFTLGLLSASQYRGMQVQISKNGWRLREPENLAIPPEKPRSFRKMAELLFGIPVDNKRLAEYLRVSPQMASEMLAASAERLRPVVSQEPKSFGTAVTPLMPSHNRFATMPNATRIRGKD